MLNHIADDYIPVIASAGVDREGNSYNVNADTAAGKVAAALARLQGDLPHRRRRLARRPRRRGLADLAGDRRRGRGGARRRSPAACGRSSRACAEAIRGGVGVGPHHRRPPPAQPAARAVHRRRHRHDGHAMSVARAAGARGALRDRHLRPGAGRVRARGGSAALGRRGQASTSTSSPGSRSTTPATATRGSSPRSPSRRRRSPAARTSSTPRRRCGSSERLVRVEPRRPRLPLQLRAPRRASARSSWSASAPTARHRAARDRHPRGRLPRPHARGAGGDPEARPRGPVRARCRRASSPSRATIPRPCARRSASARRR